MAVTPARLNAQSAGIGSYIFFGVMTMVLVAGWLWRRNSYISAESGLGYLLGILGGVLMLLLLLYPVRKHVRLMRNWGSIKYWFGTHMVFGVVGPALVLFHSNFNFGSTNSTLAMLSMLIVAGSGIAGRFFYSRIHYGLYGGKADLQELRRALKLSKGHLGEDVILSKQVLSKMRRLEKRLFAQHPVFIAFLLLPINSMLINVSRRLVVWSIKRDLRKQARKNGWGRRIFADHLRGVRTDIRDYYYLLKKTYGFYFYERLFSLWHFLHLPLFIVLIITSLVHVVVVHIY